MVARLYRGVGPRASLAGGFVAAVILCIYTSPSAVHAHHVGHELSVASPRCGWIDGDDLRDRRNLSEFCTRWVPAAFRIRSASAMKERLWLEAPTDLISGLRGDERSTAALLRNWLEHWRKITGYKTASVILLRGHVEFAKVQTTMAGDAISIR